jgi:5-methylcytosine-specific restriction endonuclease McrA
MVDVISRSQAKAAGLKLYYSGIPCPHGHLSHRYVSTYKCLACSKNETEAHKILQRERYQSDQDYAESCRQKSRERYIRIKSNPEKLASRRKKSAEYNRVRRANDPAFLEKGRKVCRERKKMWGEDQKEKHRVHARNRKARMKGAVGRYTISDVRKTFSNQKGLCPACSADLSVVGYHVDHIIPIKLGGTNWPDNIQLLCPPCNLSKAAKHPDAWLSELNKVRGEFDVEG